MPTTRDLSCSYDDVGLNSGDDLAAAVFVRNRGRDVVSCGFQFSRVSGLDFAAKRCSLTIRNGRNARRRGAAVFGSRLNRHTREACVLQFATDECRVVVAVRRACQKARRIVRKNPGERIRHIIRKYILLDAIPYAEQKMSSRLQEAPCFTVAGCAVGERTSRRIGNKRDRRLHFRTAAPARPLGAI
jgi:hypothetical protein